jgi:hypothetical protein
MKNTNIQNSRLIAFIPPMMASAGPGLMDQLLQAGIAASQYVFDPATWFFIWMWLMMLLGMLFKYLSLIPSVINNVIAYVPDLVNTLTAIC